MGILSFVYPHFTIAILVFVVPDGFFFLSLPSWGFAFGYYAMYV